MLEDDIRKGISFLDQQIEGAREKNAQLDRDIEALEEAKRHVRSAKKEAESVKSSVKRHTVERTWKGKAKKSLADAIDKTIEPGSKLLAEDLAELEKSIGAKIWELRLQKNHLVSLIDSAFEKMDGLKNDLAELVS